MHSASPYFVGRCQLVLMAVFLLLQIPQPAWATNFARWSMDSAAWESGGSCAGGLPPPAGVCTGECPAGTTNLVSGAGHDGGTAMQTIPNTIADPANGNFNAGCNFYGCALYGGGNCPRDVNVPGGGYSGGYYYLRWWMKIDPGFVWSNQRKFKAIRFGGLPGSLGDATGYVQDIGPRLIYDCGSCSGNWTGTVLWDWKPVDGCLNGAPNHNTQPACTVWNEYIIRIKWQTGANQDGEWCFYVNGQPAGTNPLGGGSAPNCVGGWSITNNGDDFRIIWGGVFAAEQYYQNGTGIMWVDDISADDTWNSTVGPQPMPPTLLPIQ